MSRIRTNLITNRMANGAPTVSNGLVISGVTTSTNVSVASSVTATTLYGDGSNLTGIAADKIFEGNTKAEVVDTGSDGKFIVETEATQRLEINSTGNITLGTASAAGNKLYFQSTSGAAQYIASGGTNNQSLIIGSSAGEFVQITSGGYVQTKSELWVGGSAPVLRWRDTTHGEKATARISGSDLYFEVNNAERVRFTSTGKSYFVGANSGGFHATTLPNGNTVNINTKTSNDGLSVIRYSGSYGPYALNIGRSKNDTIGTNALVANGDDLGHITWYGADGSDFNQAAAITVQVDGTPSNGTDMPGRILFKTTPDGSGTPVERMRINASGQVRMPSQPSFSAHRSSNNWDVSNGSVLPWDQTRHNTGSHFNTSNYRFTAPVAGTYEFSFYSIYNTNLASNNGAVAMRVNGSVPGQGTRCHFTKTNSNWDHVSYSVKISLNANDYIDMVSDGGQTIRYHGGQWSSFTGQLVS